MTKRDKRTGGNSGIFQSGGTITAGAIAVGQSARASASSPFSQENSEEVLQLIHALRRSLEHALPDSTKQALLEGDVQDVESGLKTQSPSKVEAGLKNIADKISLTKTATEDVSDLIGTLVKIAKFGGVAIAAIQSIL